LDKNSNGWLLTFTFHQRIQEGKLAGWGAVAQCIFYSEPCWLHF